MGNIQTEIVTPVPKVFPPSNINDLRKIAGLKNLSKITEQIICQYIVTDMKVDPSQYGNKKGLSVNHYLIRMVNKILTELDKNTTSEAIRIHTKISYYHGMQQKVQPKKLNKTDYHVTLAICLSCK